jgi:hypothetical protein
VKRFFWWLFWFLLYTYLVSTGQFGPQGGGNPVVVLAGVLVVFWPAVLFFGDVCRGLRK